jgi:uncharacterized membrane protein YgdD (TMEM256/DUF423 family)
VIRIWLLIAGVGGAASVVAGALAAHLAAASQAADLLRTAATYGMVHAAALVAVTALASHPKPLPCATTVAGWGFASGILLFGGSLLALAAGGAHWLGWITPFGGVALIVGWAALAVLALRRQ